MRCSRVGSKGSPYCDPVDRRCLLHPHPLAPHPPFAAEHDDVAAANPSVVSSMLARMDTIQAGAFSPVRGVQDLALGCKAAHRYGGFLGPFLP